MREEKITTLILLLLLISLGVLVTDYAIADERKTPTRQLEDYYKQCRNYFTEADIDVDVRCRLVRYQGCSYMVTECNTVKLTDHNKLQNKKKVKVNE